MQQISTCPVGRLSAPLAVPKLFGSRPTTRPSSPSVRNSSNSAARIGEPARHPLVSVGAQSASSQGALPETSRSFGNSVGGTIEFLLHAARVTLFAAAIVMTALIGKPAVPEIQKVAPKSLDAVTLDSLRPCFTVVQQHFNARPEYTKVLVIAIASYLFVSATLGILEMSSATKSQTRAVAQQVPVAASAPPPAPAAMPVTPAAADRMPAAAEKVPAAARKVPINAAKLPAWLSIAPPAPPARSDLDAEEEAPVADIAATTSPVAASAAVSPAEPQEQQPVAKPNPVFSAPALGRPVVVPSDAPRRKVSEEVLYRFGERNSNDMTVFETNRGTVVISKDATNTTTSRRDAGAAAGGVIGGSSSAAAAAEPPAGPPAVAPSTPAKSAAAAPVGVPATDVAAAVAAHVKAGGSSTSSSSAPSGARAAALDAVAPTKVGNGNGSNGAQLMVDEATSSSSSSSASKAPAAQAAPAADASSSSSTEAQNQSSASPAANVTSDAKKPATGKSSGKEKQNDPVVYAAALAWALFDSAAPKKGSKGKGSK